MLCQVEERQASLRIDAFEGWWEVRWECGFVGFLFDDDVDVEEIVCCGGGRACGGVDGVS
jgi:hypothetical protein